MAEHRITLIEPRALRPRYPAGRVFRPTVGDALFLSHVAFLVLAALTLIAGIAVVLLSGAVERDKDRALATYQSDAEIRIHSASADAAEALERAVEGRIDALTTTERTAMLVREAAALNAQAPVANAPATEARPAADPIVEREVERTLSSDQRARMIGVLIQHPGQVTLLNGRGAEAERYAGALKVLFNVSGWTVESGIVTQPRIPLAPLSVVLGFSEQDLAVRQAFEAAGVAVTERPRSPVDRPTTIYVGS
jgi:hypothetical protein